MRRSRWPRRPLPVALLRRAQGSVRGDDRLMPKALKREPDPRELRTLLLAARGDWGTFWRMWMLILVYRLAVPSVAIAVWLGLAGLF